jgi:DNA repair exonuclease SbcCD ATPase subunit
MDSEKPSRQLGHLHHTKGDEISLEQLQAINIAAAAEAAETAVKIMPSLFFAKEIGEISGKTDALGDENNKLREKIRALKRENDALKQKVEAMECQNHKQGETIRNLESSHDKLQKELEKVKTEKDLLRVEIEQITAKTSIENRMVKEEFSALAKEFEAVENENKELKRKLEELTNTVNSISEENKQLKGEMGNLKAENKQIREKLECKETRLVLGQVAWLLEAEIWKAVLPDQTMGRTGILKSMERWLRRNSSTSEGKAAQKRWDDLKGKLNWDEEDHKWALSHLKKLRHADAHPVNVDLEVARKQLKEGDYVAATDKETCEEIIDMVVTAKNLNTSI